MRKTFDLRKVNDGGIRAIIDVANEELEQRVVDRESARARHGRHGR